VTPLPSSSAIVGLGITDVGKVYGPDAAEFAAAAGRLAVRDAGLTLADIDGLLVSSGRSGGVTPQLHHQLGLHDLGLLSQITAFGATAGAMVQYASMAIAAGMATTVLCVHGDAPLQASRSASESYALHGELLTGFPSVAAAGGFAGVNYRYALAARRYMDRFGATTDQFGAVALSQRAWAAGNPLARFRDPLTLDAYRSSRWIAEPLRLLDCCMVSNGGIAVVVTSAERARDLPRTPVYVRGWGQGHPGHAMERGSEFGLVTGAVRSGRQAMAMAGVTTNDIDVCEIYDCYTYTVIVTLEDYGFCGKGEGGAFVESGVLAPGGDLPTNTGGGQLSGYYLWGMTPLSEAVIQVRGDGGARQVPKHDVVLVSGNGGVLDYHSTLILSPHPN
jgi:acetyl-CoA acetyltransferase